MLNKNIRNFTIIAHIDHGKSTLADRMLEVTNAVNKRNMKDRFLDQMELEKERGITIKSQTVRLKYKFFLNKETYFLNLIDTPGHVDFQYEVCQYIAACEGVLLLIDASKGVQSQTIAHAEFAKKYKIPIIPIINKIDVPNIDLIKIQKELTASFDIPSSSIISISAKYGIGIDLVFKNIIELIPPPHGESNDLLKAVILDSWYDIYKGIILLIRVFTGKVSDNQEVRCIDTNKQFNISQVGIFAPKKIYVNCLYAGEVGFVVTNIKSSRDIQIGGAIICLKNLLCIKNTTPISLPKHTVFSGLYPLNSNDYNKLKDRIEKFALNDSSFYFEQDASQLLGYGFRCGFLGLLHMDIVRERIEREFGISLIITPPTVKYKIFMKNKKTVLIDNPSKMPHIKDIKYCQESFVKMQVHAPYDYMGSILTLCQNKRGEYLNTEYLNNSYIDVFYIMPLSEIITDFFDSIKSISKGYATFTYNIVEYKITNILKIDILINNKIIDILSFISHINKYINMARTMCDCIKNNMNRQQYTVIIQAATGQRIVAKSILPALKKDVTSKCYGGDITRKKKLLQKQKIGKEKMKSFGNLKLSKSFFFKLLNTLYL